MKIEIYVISDVIQHPEEEKWTIVKFDNYSVISSKLEDDTNRYNVGDTIIYCPVNSVIPEFMLKHGYWNEVKNKGTLGGSKGNRVKSFRGSTGIIFPIKFQEVMFGIIEIYCCNKLIRTISHQYIDNFISNYDFAPDLGIGEYIPK
jgi:hypothetical protein